MGSRKNVKLMLWGDVVVCAMYLKNRSPSLALAKNYPFEIWYGHIILVRHINIFGSTCYALTPKEKTNKLGTRS